MRAPVSTLLGGSLIVIGVVGGLAVSVRVVNGVSLLALLVAICGLAVMLTGLRRARLQAIVPTRGTYRLELVGGGRWVFADDRTHRAVEVRSFADLDALSEFMDGRGLYVIDGDKRRTIRRYLEDVSAGVAA